MKTVLWVSLCCGTLLVCQVCSGSDSPDPQTDGVSNSIVVYTASGRRFRGEAAPKTDITHLWLRSTYGASSALRPIRWDRVVRVEIGEQVYSGEEFWDAYRAILPLLPPPAARPTAIRMVGSPPDASRPAAVQPVDLRAPLAFRLPAPEMPVRSMRIEARAANWDSDVEVDGLLVEVQPLNAWGQPVPVEGTLVVHLFGHPNTPVNRPEPPVQLGRWSQLVVAEDFGLNGATYRFPFQRPDPALNLSISPDELVNARLNVPGQGVFEASECVQRLRPYCSFRDEMYRATGRWYLPLERAR
jgi:hypothetical protein